MGVRPPPDDMGGEPDVVTFGIAALDGRLDDAEIDFPASSDDLRRALGNQEVPYDAAGHTVSLEWALESAAVDQFETRQDLLNALHPVFEERRANTSTGVIAQLRTFLPF